MNSNVREFQVFLDRLMDPFLSASQKSDYFNATCEDMRDRLRFLCLPENKQVESSERRKQLALDWLAAIVLHRGDFDRENNSYRISLPEKLVPHNLSDRISFELLFSTNDIDEAEVKVVLKRIEQMNYLVTLNIGNCLCGNARESFEHAARRWKVPYHEITVRHHATLTADAKHTKLFLFDMVMSNAERIFFVDADCLIRSDTPNPFEVFPDKLCMARDYPPATFVIEEMRKCTELLKLEPFDMGEYFNSGVMMIPRRLAADAVALGLQAVKYFNVTARLADQNYYNILGRISGVHRMEQTWNYLNGLKFKEQDAYIYHWAGVLDITKTNWRKK